MEFTLKRLADGEILTYYRRHIVKEFGKEEEKNLVLPEACIAGLIAKKLYKAYALFSGRKFIGLCFLISDSKDSIFLLHYFYIVKKYRGYNYADILFELVIRLINNENKERKSPAIGIFLELRGIVGLSEEGEKKREKELRFYKSLGAYMTDLLPNFEEEYNVLFLPIFKRLTRTELKELFLSIYKDILPSFKDNKKYIKRYTE